MYGGHFKVLMVVEDDWQDSDRVTQRGKMECPGWDTMAMLGP